MREINTLLDAGAILRLDSSHAIVVFDRRQHRRAATLRMLDIVIWLVACGTGGDGCLVRKVNGFLVQVPHVDKMLNVLG